MIRDQRLINFGKLFFGSTLGQIIALALYPYIARLYSPEDFSKFGFVFSLTTIISVFATGQFHSAIMNPKDENEAKGLVGLATSLATAFSVLTVVTLYFIDPTLCVVGIYLFFYSLFEIERMYFIRSKEYGASAGTQFAFRFLGNGSKLLPNLVQLQSTGLILSEISALVLVVGYGFSKKVFNFTFDYSLAKKYFSFPIFHSTSIALNLMISDFPILFWTTKFTGPEIGYFVMGQKLLLVPAVVASQALQNATVHHLIESATPRKFFLKTLGIMLLVSLLGTTFFHFFGREFVSFLLGPKWVGGEEVFRFLSFLLLTRLTYALIQAVYILKNATRLILGFRIVQLISLFLINQLNLSFSNSLLLYVAIEFVTELMLLLRASHILKPPFIFRKSQ